MQKIIMKIFIVFVSIIAVVALIAVIILSQPKFGRTPRGERLARSQKSWHYQDGQWQNEVETQTFTGDKGWVRTLGEFLFVRTERLRPDKPVPAVKTDLRSLPDSTDWIVWFGHSSYLLNLAGKKVLVDPVFYEANPFPFGGHPFEGTDLYRPDDLPEYIDLLLITHDHWDHLDYKTVRPMQPRIGRVVAPLGVGEHFAYWGYPESKLTDLDWWEAKELEDGFRVTCTPQRHFSGRGLKRNRALWGSFVLETPHGAYFFGGDGGYGPHFQAIGQRFDLRLAILENGQYNTQWANIHTLPEQLGQEASDLRAQEVITGHHSKFVLARHPWDEPLMNERKAAQDNGINLTVLTIGEPYFLKGTSKN